MRILKATQTYYPYLRMGGPPRKIRGIARALARDGHAVTVLTSDLGPVDQAVADSKRYTTEWGWQTEQDGVTAIYLPAVARYRATSINPRVHAFCRARLADFDLVHIYGLYDLIGPMVAHACRRANLPYVLEPLGMYQPKIRSLQKKRLYHAVAGRSLVRNADAIVVASETESRELTDGGIPPEKIFLRRNGIDLDEFRSLPPRGALRERYQIGHRTPLVLFLGRLSAIKGLDLLLSAFAAIEGDARLLIAGPDDGDGSRAALRQQIAELNLSDRVILSGALRDLDRNQALVDADLLVLPSRYESFGNVAAEAVACGLPVLLTDRCGIAPLLAERSALVVACDVSSLQSGLERMLSDDAYRSRLRANCAAVARELSWEEPVAMMERIYGSLIAGSARESLSPFSLWEKGRG